MPRAFFGIDASILVVSAVIRPFTIGRISFVNGLRRLPRLFSNPKIKVAGHGLMSLPIVFRCLVCVARTEFDRP